MCHKLQNCMRIMIILLISHDDCGATNVETRLVNKIVCSFIEQTVITVVDKSLKWWNFFPSAINIFNTWVFTINYATVICQ